MSRKERSVVLEKVEVVVCVFLELAATDVLPRGLRDEQKGLHFTGREPERGKNLTLVILPLPFSLSTFPHTSPSHFGNFFARSAKGGVNSLLKFLEKISTQNIFSSFLPNLIN